MWGAGLVVSVGSGPCGGCGIIKVRVWGTASDGVEMRGGVEGGSLWNKRIVVREGRGLISRGEGRGSDSKGYGE